MADEDQLLWKIKQYEKESSHFDISLFNRLVSIYFKEDVATYEKAHSFFTIDRTDEIDNYLKKEIEEEKSGLHQKIGQLSVEVDFLKKKLNQLK